MYRQFQLSYYQNATKDFHAAYFTQPIDALKPHAHDYYQLYFVEEGVIGHYMEKVCGKLHKGDVFILPPNMQHYIEKQSDQIGFYSISFTETYFPAHDRGTSFLSDFLYYLKQQTPDTICPAISLNAEQYGMVRQLLQQICQEFRQKKPGFQEIIYHNLATTLSLVARSYYKTVPSISYLTAQQKVMQAVEFINVHYAEDITLESIVAGSQISKANFCKLFSGLAGMTFNQFLHTRRIEKARELIFEGYKIAQVSTLCGYKDFSTFFRNFKKITGISPTDYKAAEMSHSK